MQEFSVVPKICVLENCRDFMEEFNINQRDLIITTEFLYHSYLEKLNVKAHYIFQDRYGLGEPTDEMILAMYEAMKELIYDRIIAIGGGSVIDISKILGLKNIFPLSKLFEKELEIEKDKKLIIVPTTCGTGSEVTNISIVNLLSMGTKKGLAVPELFPEYAVLISELLEKLPSYVFSTSSIDALIHAVESFLSPKATVYSRMFSKEAIVKIVTAYRKIEEEGIQAREKYIKDILIASNMAGIAFGNAGCAAVHAMSYPLGGKYHVPHGESNYVIFLGVLRYYYQKNPKGSITELNAILKSVLQYTEETVYDRLEKLLSVLLVKKKISEYGVKVEELEEFTEIVMKQQQRLMANNYVHLSKEEVYTIYRELY